MPSLGLEQINLSYEQWLQVFHALGDHCAWEYLRSCRFRQENFVIIPPSRGHELSNTEKAAVAYLTHEFDWDYIPGRAEEERVTELEAQQAKLIEIVDRGLVSVSIAETAPAEGPANDAEALPPAPQSGSAKSEAPIEIRVGQRWRHRSTHAPVVRVAAADGGIYKWTLEVEKTGDVCRVSDQWFANAILISEGES